MSFLYKKILVIGATSGIGHSLTRRLLSANITVLAAGRRLDLLADLPSAIPLYLDITDLASLPAFAASLTAIHPDLDCVVLNAGIQRSLDFSDPHTVNLDVLNAELTTSYIGPVTLVHALLPHLLSRPFPTALIFTTSALAMVPLVRCPGYCAAKAAMHAWILSVREQLRQTGVKVVEILPPAVRTGLHDPEVQGNIPLDFGMPLEEFVDEAWRQLREGREEVVVGTARRWYEIVERPRQEVFRSTNEYMKSVMGTRP